MGQAILESYRPFDAANANTAFDTGIYEPTMRQFKEERLPAIDQTFAGDLFSGMRQKAVEDATTKMGQSLEAERAKYVAGREEAHYNRQVALTGVAMDLINLPADQAEQTANIEYKRAAAAGLFTDMETQRALVDSQITSNQLSALVTLMNIFGGEQAQTQAEWNAAMQNALTADGGMDWSAIMSLLMGYQDQSQITYVPA